MKLLDGRELAGFIKERQAKQVRGLRQAWGVFPKLAIVQTGDNEVSNVYMRVKQRYGEDILVDVDIHRVAMSEAVDAIARLNADESVHGIIVQLPLEDATKTDEVLAAVVPSKDVDGLGPQSEYSSATATAVDWLAAGYNVTLKGRPIAIVGHGRLVGAPLAELWRAAGLDVTVCDETTDDLTSALRAAQVVVSATGQAGLITERMLQPGAVVIDAGASTEGGRIVGDVAASVRERDDLTITPEQGGVGPLSVASLFDNVITAARKVADRQDEA